MVTHDVGLKNYADRVIKVVDGKINSEYSIDKSAKYEIIMKLQENLKNTTSLREGAKSVSSSSLNSSTDNQNNSRTFYRKASDYVIKRKSINN